MHEDGIGMARTFELEFTARADDADRRPRRASSPGSTAPPAEGYRAPADRCRRRHRGARCGPRRDAPVGILTGAYGARGARARSSTSSGATTCAWSPVDNEFFGGNIGVTGLLVGADLARVLADEPEGHRYLLPDVCLSEGRFLDGIDARRPAPSGRGRRRPTASRCGAALDGARRPERGGMTLPVVAIVGRPNVGKSTLSTASSAAARRSSRRSPGVTRDRKELEAEWQGAAFRAGRHRRLAARWRRRSTRR